MNFGCGFCTSCDVLLCEYVDSTAITVQGARLRHRSKLMDENNYKRMESPSIILQSYTYIPNEILDKRRSWAGSNYVCTILFRPKINVFEFNPHLLRLLHLSRLIL